MNKTKKHKTNKTEKYNFKSNKNKTRIKYKTVKYKQQSFTPLDDKNVVDVNVNLKPFEKEHELNLSNRQLIITNEQVKSYFIKQLLAPFSPSSIKPTTNFYNYINYLWLKNTKLDEKQQYIIQIDNFRLVQDKVYTQLYDIILDYIKHNNNKLSKNLSNYYKTVVNYNSIESARKYAKDYTIFVDDLRKDKKNLWKLLANVNHH